MRNVWNSTILKESPLNFKLIASSISFEANQLQGFASTALVQVSVTSRDW